MASPLVIRLFLLLLVTCGAFAVLGYHPGVEDDGTYLASIEHDLNPALFPHDLQFVSGQLQLTLFDKVIAASVRVTHLSLAWTELLWQFAGLYVLLLACWEIAALCFDEASARWGGVCFVGVMLAMPVSMTELFLADQHLHPRLLATDCILLAALAILKGHGWIAVPLLIAGAFLHPLMTAFGISFCCFLAAEKRWGGWWLGALQRTRAGVLVLPSCWLWAKPNPAWKRVVASRSFFYLFKWPWYGWITILGPIGLVAWLRAMGRRRERPVLELLCSALLVFAVFQLLIAMFLLAPGMPMWFLQFEPMRFLHLVYLLGALLGAGAFARFWLKSRVWRWMLIFLPLIGVMYGAQAHEFAGSPHMEWPGAAPRNPWLQAFAWIRENTPADAYFALNPRYADMPGESVHSFRALSERGMLADDLKDTGVVTHMADLAPRWARESSATADWTHFNGRDFERLRQEFGVNWILVARAQPELDCPYHNAQLWVCRL